MRRSRSPSASTSAGAAEAIQKSVEGLELRLVSVSANSVKPSWAMAGTAPRPSPPTASRTATLHRSPGEGFGHDLVSNVMILHLRWGQRRPVSASEPGSSAASELPATSSTACDRRLLRLSQPQRPGADPLVAGHDRHEIDPGARGSAGGVPAIPPERVLARGQRRRPRLSHLSPAQVEDRDADAPHGWKR